MREVAACLDFVKIDPAFLSYLFFNLLNNRKDPVLVVSFIADEDPAHVCLPLVLYEIIHNPGENNQQ